MHAKVLSEDFLDQLFDAIDNKDAQRFARFMTRDAEFRFGSSPAVRGRDAIESAVAQFFATIDGLSHRIARTWRDESSLACEGEVCYRRLDGREVLVPFVDVFRFEDDLISSYRIYVDIGPLYADP